MKDPSNRTKVVVRNLPPSLSRSSFFEQIDLRFAGRYNWSSFSDGINSPKRQSHARAYINFNSPEDVFEFAEFFNGHVFVNEKGAQFKATVEYSPSQRVPKPSGKKDGREGTISRDPEYVEFLEQISKPSENLPSADVQLERREAERAGVQESPIVTPLMEFVRRKRAGKNGRQATSDLKISGRARVSSPRKSRSNATKLVPEKKKYILKTSGKSKSGKDKSTNFLVPPRDDRLDTLSGERLTENDSGASSVETGKKKILLLKGKEQDISGHKGAASFGENSSVLPDLKSHTSYDASGRIIRGILLNKETRQNQPSAVQSEQRLQSITSERGKRPPRPASIRSSASGYAFSNEPSPVSSDPVGKRTGDDKFGANHQNGMIIIREKQERRTRNRERLDHGVWTPLRRSDPLHASPEHMSHSSQTIPKSHEANGEKSGSNLQNQGGEVVTAAGVRKSGFIENGSNSKHFMRRGPAHIKDVGFSSEGKSSKRGSAGSGHSPHEKQVWIQKSASGS
ncbi:hypothetical protein Dimus_027149 [Dionaea muscipula]